MKKYLLKNPKIIIKMIKEEEEEEELLVWHIIERILIVSK
jgi:hypothetical protein